MRRTKLSYKCRVCGLSPRWLSPVQREGDRTGVGVKQDVFSDSLDERVQFLILRLARHTLPALLTRTWGEQQEPWPGSVVGPWFAAEWTPLPPLPGVALCPCASWCRPQRGGQWAVGRDVLVWSVGAADSGGGQGRPRVAHSGSGQDEPLSRCACGSSWCRPQ